MFARHYSLHFRHFLAAGACAFLAFAVSNCRGEETAKANTSLAKRIQKEIDENPFVKELGIKLTVTKEEKGYVGIEMSEGSREIRTKIAQGKDILTTEIERDWFLGGSAAKDKETLNILRRVIVQVQGMQGVKMVNLTALWNTQKDKAQDLYDEACKERDAKNYDKAAIKMREAASAGLAAAQNDLGVMYGNGQGFPKDEAKAVEWYRKAAEQGDSNAQCNVGIIYKNGQGVLKDEAMAVVWFRKAADAGLLKAQVTLAGMYFDGQGITKDRAKAAELFRKAAEQGDATAQCNLGGMYSNGRGILKDYAKAIECFSKAANQEDDSIAHASGHNELAWLYSTCPNAQYRNAEKALKHALEVTRKISDNFMYQGTLAAAYAANGQFDKAKASLFKSDTLLWNDKSIDGAKKLKYSAGHKKMKNLFENGQPYIHDEKDWE